MTEFKVGDKVVVNYNGLGAYPLIGEVIRVTKKRRDVVVKFNGYERIFSSSGYQKNCNYWNAWRIQLLTPEMEEELNRRKIIERCQDLIKNIQANLTYEQAIKIIEILEGEN